MRVVKQFVRQLVLGFVWLLGCSKLGRFIQGQMALALMEKTLRISVGESTYALTTPNSLCYFRAMSFASKEPATLRWIDEFPANSVFWDIGANVGLYSVYAAKKRGCQVWSFEPSVFNLECLARNLFLNDVVNRVCIVPIALNDSSGPSHLNMTSTEWGGALSTFGQTYGFDGKSMAKVFSFQTLGCSIDDARAQLDIPQPDYIKIDVDGIEHLILKGGSKVLQGVKGVLIEVNDEFFEQSETCKAMLQSAGLLLQEKHASEVISGVGHFSHIFNQIWVKPKLVDSDQNPTPHAPEYP